MNVQLRQYAAFVFHKHVKTMSHRKDACCHFVMSAWFPMVRVRSTKDIFIINKQWCFLPQSSLRHRYWMIYSGTSLLPLYPLSSILFVSSLFVSCLSKSRLMYDEWLTKTIFIACTFLTNKSLKMNLKGWLIVTKVRMLRRDSSRCYLDSTYN